MATLPESSLPEVTLSIDHNGELDITLNECGDFPQLSFLQIQENLRHLRHSQITRLSIADSVLDSDDDIPPPPPLTTLSRQISQEHSVPALPILDQAESPGEDGFSFYHVLLRQMGFESPEIEEAIAQCKIVSVEACVDYIVSNHSNSEAEDLPAFKVYLDEQCCKEQAARMRKVCALIKKGEHRLLTGEEQNTTEETSDCSPPPVRMAMSEPSGVAASLALPPLKNHHALNLVALQRELSAPFREKKATLNKTLKAVNKQHVKSSSVPIAPNAPELKMKTKIGGNQVVSSSSQQEEEELHNPCTMCYSANINIYGGSMHASCYSHNIACTDCLLRYLIIAINEGKVLAIRCIQYNCQETYQECHIKDFLHNVGSEEAMEAYRKYERFLHVAQVSMDPKARWCPTPDCPGLMYGSNWRPHLTCTSCKHELCFKCNLPWHSGSCRKALQQASNSSESSGSAMTKLGQAARDAASMASYKLTNNVKNCPKCQIPVERSEGCNHMTCRCKHEWCWMCRSKYTDNHFEIWNLWGCPAGQSGGMSCLGDDMLCCLNLSCGCGLFGRIKRTIAKVLLVGCGCAIVPAGAILCSPVICYQVCRR